MRNRVPYSLDPRLRRYRVKDGWNIRKAAGDGIGHIGNAAGHLGFAAAAPFGAVIGGAIGGTRGLLRTPKPEETRLGNMKNSAALGGVVGGLTTGVLGGIAAESTTLLPLYHGARILQSPYEIGRHAGVNAQRGYRTARHPDMEGERYIPSWKMDPNHHDIENFIPANVYGPLRPVAEVTGRTAYGAGYGAGFSARKWNDRKVRKAQPATAEGTVKGTARGARANRERKREGNVGVKDGIASGALLGAALGGGNWSGVGALGGAALSLGEMAWNRNAGLINPIENFQRGRADAGSRAALNSMIPIPRSGGFRDTFNPPAMKLQYLKPNAKGKYGVTRPRNYRATNSKFQQGSDRLEDLFDDQDNAVYHSRWRAPYSTMVNSAFYGTGYGYGKVEQMKNPFKKANPIRTTIIPSGTKPLSANPAGWAFAAREQ